MRFIYGLFLLVAGWQLCEARTVHAEPLWDLKRLSVAPKVEWIDKTGDVRRLYYEAEPYQGKPTRVFAWYAQPAKAEGKLPAMVLLHGGGGTAFKQWAELWANRGYVAIAMDLSGMGEKKNERLPDGGPRQDDRTKFPNKKIDLRDMWSYHAVADAILANSLLRSLPNVDAERVGLTGISWGGYLTCIVAGVDDRFKVAVPVYGCGFLHENSDWLSSLARLDKDWRQEWITNFDPSKYVGNAKMPMLFINGTNDDAYPLDSYQKTYRLVKNRTLCITVNMPHGHPPGWAPKEIGEFVDMYLKKGKPFLEIPTNSLRIRENDGKNEMIFCRLKDSTPQLEAIDLIYTEDLNKPWKQRKWQTIHFTMKASPYDLWRVDVPTARPINWYANFKDKHGRVTSSEHELLEK